VIFTGLKTVTHGQCIATATATEYNHPMTGTKLYPLWWAQESE